MCSAPQRHALFRRLNLQKWSEHGVFCTFWLGNVLRATTACTFSTSEPPKVVRPWCVLYIFTSKCASRHNGVHFFDISTSKSGPNLVCFVHFHFKMCFAPQRRALFRHLNFQKWSEAGVFCTFWLGNVLRATTACNFSFLIWPAGFAPAALASLLFDPPEPQIIGKTQCFATFSVSRRSYLFAHLQLLSSDLVSSDSSHLCFSTVHIVGSFTSKLPSIIFVIVFLPKALAWCDFGFESRDKPCMRWMITVFWFCVFCFVVACPVVGVFARQRHVASLTPPTSSGNHRICCSLAATGTCNGAGNVTSWTVMLTVEQTNLSTNLWTNESVKMKLRKQASRLGWSCLLQTKKV